MSFDLQAILELGELDQKLLRLRARLKRAPDLAAPQRARVDKAKKELAAIDGEGKLGLKEVKRLELEAKTKKHYEENMAKYKQRKAANKDDTVQHSVSVC